MAEHIRAGRTKIEQVHLLRQSEHVLHVAAQVGLFLREIGRQRPDEALAALGDAITLAVFGKVEAIRTVIVDVAQPNLVKDAQITADAPDVAARLHTADDVHTRVEHAAEPAERLQAAADGGILLEYRHLHTLLRQDGTRKQAAQSTAYDHYALHSLALMIWS